MERDQRFVQECVALFMDLQRRGVDPLPLSIGTLNEKPLHAALKAWCFKPGDRMEAPVDGFTVDIVRNGLLIEIQTGNLSAIRQKLAKLAENHPVRLIYPVARELWILRPPGNSRRKSPRRGSIASIFEEFVSIAPLLAHPNFTFQVVFIQEEQVRSLDRGRSRRRKGWRTSERRLLRVVDECFFDKPEDMLSVLPESLQEPFTTGDLAETAGHPVWLAQKIAYCLRTMGAVDRVGKRGRWILYARVAGSGKAQMHGGKKGQKPGDRSPGSDC